MDDEKLKRWRLILGRDSQQRFNDYSNGNLNLGNEYMIMDEALSQIYDETNEGKGAGLGVSSPKIAKWLGDIRTFFPEDVVSVIQADAIEKKGLRQLLFEPEVLKSVKPDINMVASLMSLGRKIPEKSKETARMLVNEVVQDIKKRLENDIRQAVTGALNKREHSPIPNVASIDWKYTINKNLKNYNSEYKKIIPERFYFFSRAKRSNDWTIILDIDQSGSMAESVIYASIIGSIFASIPALNTRVVAFDTSVVDLTEECHNDPVEMLFGVQLGGGTDINKSLGYCKEFITEPKKTIFILVSDLYEGGNQAGMLRKIEEMHDAGVKVMCLLALSDSGTPSYDEGCARKISKMGVPCFGCSPDRLAELVERCLKGVNKNESRNTLSKN